MPFFEVFLISISMAMDAFAVCLAAGTLETIHGPRPLFRLSFHFGLFQFIMPVIGWLLGATIQPLIHNYTDWIAFGLLVSVGIHMIYTSAARRNISFRTIPRAAGRWYCFPLRSAWTR